MQRRGFRGVVRALAAGWLCSAVPGLFAQAGHPEAGEPFPAYYVKRKLISKNTVPVSCGEVIQEVFVRANGERLERNSAPDCFSNETTEWWRVNTKAQMITAGRRKGVFVKTSYRYKPDAHERRLARAYLPKTNCLQTGVGFRQGRDEGIQVIHGFETRVVVEGWTPGSKSAHYRAPLLRCESIQWYERSSDGMLDQWSIPFRVVAGEAAEKAVEAAFADLDRADELSPIQAASKLRRIDPDTLREDPALLKQDNLYNCAPARP